jgi:hypothetical protein
MSQYEYQPDISYQTRQVTEYQEVMDTIASLDSAFASYLTARDSQLPQVRLEQIREIRVALDQFLYSNFTALPPDAEPVPQTCPRCHGKGTI